MKYCLKIIATVILLLPINKSVLAQVAGCTDVQALNYNANATSNDGSCLYPLTVQTVTTICTLPPVLTEASGLVNYNHQLITHADGGNPSVLYSINSTTGQVLDTTAITNAPNIDWEEVCASNTQLFIADIGNNAGTRKDLKLYKISLQLPSNNTVQAQVYPFVYSNQDSFNYNLKTNFDAEACLAFDDTVFIFSKSWASYTTNVYKLICNGQDSVANIVDSFNVNGLITGATFDAASKRIALLGYDTSGNTFIWLLWHYNYPHFFSGNKRRLSFGLVLGQCEGIAFKDSNTLYVVNETYSILAASLKQIDIKPYFGVINNFDEYTKPQVVGINGFLIKNNLLEPLAFNIYTMQGQQVISNLQIQGGHSVGVPMLASGTYVYIAQQQNGVISKGLFFAN
jgi:hypothetical protein